MRCEHGVPVSISPVSSRTLCGSSRLTRCPQVRGSGGTTGMTWVPTERGHRIRAGGVPKTDQFVRKPAGMWGCPLMPGRPDRFRPVSPAGPPCSRGSPRGLQARPELSWPPGLGAAGSEEVWRSGAGGGEGPLVLSSGCFPWLPLGLVTRRSEGLWLEQAPAASNRRVLGVVTTPQKLGSLLCQGQSSDA